MGFLGPDHPLYEPAVRGAQVFPEVGVSIRALDDLRQVGAGGEAPTFAPKDYAANLLVAGGLTQCVVQLLVHRGVEGVQLLRPVQGDVGHRGGFLVQHGLVQLAS